MRAAAILTSFLLLSGGVLVTSAEEKKASEKGRSLFNGENLDGWKLRPGRDPKKSKWRVAARVALVVGRPNRFVFEEGPGFLLNAEDGHGVDLLSETQHGDRKPWVCSRRRGYFGSNS